MDMKELLSRESILLDVEVNSSKQVLQRAAAYAAKRLDESERDIFDALIERERLGSTGVGGGVSIPHARMAHLDKMYGLFIRTAEPIDFDAIDGKPVDLLFVLLAPEHSGAEHLRALARISRLLRDGGNLAVLRESTSSEKVYQLLTADAC